jgi:hypothetical protein
MFTLAGAATSRNRFAVTMAAWLVCHRGYRSGNASDSAIMICCAVDSLSTGGAAIDGYDMPHRILLRFKFC